MYHRQLLRRVLGKNGLRPKIRRLSSGNLHETEEELKGKWRWVGRRIHPQDACFTVLPWGFVPQDVVQREIVPRAIERYEKAHQMPLGPDYILQAFSTSKKDVEDGAVLAYDFLTKHFSLGDPCFENTLNDTVHPALGACFDMQLQQLDKPLIEVEAIHEAKVTCAFPLLDKDPTDPSALEQSSILFGTLGVNTLTAQMHFAKFMMKTLMKQLYTGKDEGLRLAVEVIIKTTERSNFGPNANEKMDASHCLWFHTARGHDILADDEPQFELTNMNEALSMIQDTAVPEEWAYPH